MWRPAAASSHFPVSGGHLDREDHCQTQGRNLTHTRALFPEVNYHSECRQTCWHLNQDNHTIFHKLKDLHDDNELMVVTQRAATRSNDVNMESRVKLFVVTQFWFIFHSSAWNTDSIGPIYSFRAKHGHSPFSWMIPGLCPGPSVLPELSPMLTRILYPATTREISQLTH